MTKYNPGEPCPKCGEERHRLEHVRANVGERLMVTCQRCGFVRNRLPLDAPDEPAHATLR